MNADMFASQIAAFKGRFHVLAIDLPGHGASRELAFSMPAACRCVTDILEHEKVTSCHLVGQSMGGIICQLLMRDRPELATSLTLIGSVPLTAPLYRLKWLPFLLVAGMIRFAPRAPVNRLIALAAGSRPGTRLYIETRLRAFDRPALSRIVGEIAGTLEAGPYPAPAGRSKPPVLMICGTRDFLALGLTIYLARRWAARMDADMHAIPQASHNANMDQPDRVNALMTAFLQRAPEQRNRSIAESDI